MLDSADSPVGSMTGYEYVTGSEVFESRELPVDCDLRITAYCHNNLSLHCPYALSLRTVLLSDMV